VSEVGRSLQTLWVIFKHEFSLFFISPIVYFIGAGWLFFAGLFFTFAMNNYNSGYAEPNMTSVLGSMAFLLIFIAPAITMRMISEEIRTGTHELLFTSPVRDWEIVVGKWLSAWGVLTIFILLTTPYPLILIWRGTPDTGLMLAGYLGIWLLAGAVLAIGILTSALSQYQLVAFMLGMAALITLWLADAFVSLVSGVVASDVLTEITLQGHYHDTMLSRGLVSPLDVGYFVGMIILSLFIATQVLGTRRWRA
jgi:ABC-2 type transport system permease protein